jgi:hypothetical protein
MHGRYQISLDHSRGTASQEHPKIYPTSISSRKPSTNITRRNESLIAIKQSHCSDIQANMLVEELFAALRYDSHCCTLKF